MELINNRKGILLKAIEANDIAAIKDWAYTNHEVNGFGLYPLIEHVKDANMLSSIFHMFGEELKCWYDKIQKSIINDAIEAGKDLKIIEAILNFDKKCINRIDGFRMTPLMYSINRDISIIKLLLENNAEVNICNRVGDTPLHFARTSEVVKLLIEYGANVNYTNRAGWTPLMTALHYEKDKEICFELIKNGADVNIRDYGGQTCLHFALCNKYDKDVIYEICSKTVDYNIEANNGLTPLCYALKDQLHRQSPYKISFIKNLIKNGFIVNSNVFMYVVRNCTNVDFIASLIKFVDIRYVDKIGNCVLHEVYDVRVIDFLARRGVPVNHENNEGITPLTKAIIWNIGLEIIERLLFWGSDLQKSLNYLDENEDDYFVFLDDICPILILYGMNTTLKTDCIRRCVSETLLSVAEDKATNYRLLRHIFLTNESTRILETLQIRENATIHELFKIYNSEIDKMKEEKFVKNISYYDFCTKQYRSVRRQFDYNALTEVNYEKINQLFPIFFEVIDTKIKINIKINKRRNSLRKLNNVHIAKLIERENHSQNEEEFSCEKKWLYFDVMFIIGCFMSHREINCLLAAAILD